jgi:hypothetical protein
MNIDRVLYHTSKDKMLMDWDSGAMTHAVAQDVIEQGL